MPFDPTALLTRDNFRGLPVLVTDGAWGTEMARRGARPGQMCDTWNVDEPEKVREVAGAYVDAGAQAILTNTFNSNRIVLAKHGLAEQAFALTRAGAAISREAAEGKALVFGSMGPCGKLVMMGEIDPAEVEEAAAEQARAFAEGGAHAIVLETQSDLVEAEAALKGIAGATDLPFGTTFTFDAGADNDRTMMGVSIPEVYDLARRAGCSFVGANCGAGIESFVNIAAQFRVCGDDLPIWVKGNAGQPVIGDDGQTCYKAPPALYADCVAPLLEAGARFIGGCCGSTPDHVRAMVQRLAELT